jgi:pyrimidine-specific ribonucleoside hydrolase
VASAGNVDVDTAAEVAARLVAALGLPSRVEAARGLRIPPRLHGPDEEPFHGSDGLGGQLSSLPEAPAPPDHDAAALAGADVLATGPLTAVSSAIEAGHRPSRVLWMGGAVRTSNATATAEFNAWCEPAAADVLLTSGIPTAVVPIDITRQVHLDERDLARWRASGSVSAVLADAFAAMTSRGERTPHDAVAAVAWLRPELFAWEPRRVRCDSGSERLRGTLLVEPLGAPAGPADAADARTDTHERAAAALPPAQLATAVAAEAVHDAIVEAVVAAAGRGPRG